jgi:cell division protein FtsB
MRVSEIDVLHTRIKYLLDRVTELELQNEALRQDKMTLEHMVDDLEEQLSTEQN